MVKASKIHLKGDVKSQLHKYMKMQSISTLSTSSKATGVVIGKTGEENQELTVMSDGCFQSVTTLKLINI